MTIWVILDTLRHFIPQDKLTLILFTDKIISDPFPNNGRCPYLSYNICAPDIGASIYETDTGKLVWRESHSVVAGDPTILSPPASDYLVDLFADLENAVPRQLIK